MPPPEERRTSFGPPPFSFPLSESSEILPMTEIGRSLFTPPPLVCASRSTPMFGASATVARVAVRLRGDRGADRPAGGLGVDGAADVADGDAAARGPRVDGAADAVRLERAARRLDLQVAADVAGDDAAAARVQRGVAAGRVEADVAAGRVRVDRTVDVREAHRAAGRVRVHEAMEVSHAHIAARRLELDVVARRHGHVERHVEVVAPRKPPRHRFDFAPDVYVVPTLLHRQVNAVELFLAPRVPLDRHDDAARSRHDMDVADVGVEVERAAGAGVEGAADRAVDRGMRGERQETENCGGERDANAMHGRPPVAQYAGEGERLAAAFGCRLSAVSSPESRELTAESPIGKIRRHAHR